MKEVKEECEEEWEDMREGCMGMGMGGMSGMGGGLPLLRSDVFDSDLRDFLMEPPNPM